MHTLGQLGEEAGRCTLCALAETRTQVVFGTGSKSADLMLIGEAPGQREDATGVPFVGQAGKLLDQILESVGLRRDDLYIANVLKCRPPQNRNPRREEIEACRPFLDEQIRIIAPRVLVPMGNFALGFLADKKLSISKAHGKMFPYRGIAAIPIYHPAAVLYNRTLEPVLAGDFREIVDYIGSGAKVRVEPDQLTLF